MYSKRQGGLALSKVLWLHFVCLQGGWTAANWLYGPNLQDIDYLRQPTINYSKLPSVTPCAFSCSFLPALSPPTSLNLSFFLSNTQSLYSFFPCSCSVLPTPCIPDCAVPCWASGSSLVLQRRSLIQCFEKLSGRMWLIYFTLKALTCLIHSAAEWDLHVKWPSCCLPYFFAPFLSVPHWSFLFHFLLSYFVFSFFDFY